MVGTEKLRIYISIGFGGEHFKDFKSFKKYARENFVDDLTKSILERSDFIFGETYYLTFDCYGSEMTEKVEINAYTC